MQLVLIGQYPYYFLTFDHTFNETTNTYLILLKCTDDVQVRINGEENIIEVLKVTVKNLIGYVYFL